MIQVDADGLALWAAAFVPHIAINKAVWAGGLTLECILAFVVFSRKIAGRFPAFAALMVCYPLGAGLLFACGGRIDSSVYDSLHRFLSLIEFALQMLLAGEIAFHWAQETGSLRRWYGLLIALAAGAAGLAWSVSAFAAGKVAIDGLDVFVWFLMAGLFAVIVRESHPGNLIRIAAGFAAFSVIQLVAFAGRLHARTGRDLREYFSWSYVPAAGYIAVVIFWLVALQRESGAVSAEENVTAH